MLLKSCLFALVMTVALSSCATRTLISPGIHSWVADATTGRPLAGVRVSANDTTDRTAVSDAGGWFRLAPAYRNDRVIPGEFHVASLPTLKLRLSLEGYEVTYTSTETINAYEPIRMKPLPEALSNRR